MNIEQIVKQATKATVPTANMPNVIRHTKPVKLFADPIVEADLIELHELKRQAKTLALVIKEKEDFIKSYMGDSVELFDMSGHLAATYKYDRAKQIDEIALKAQFPKAYKAVIEVNKTRLERMYPEAFEAVVTYTDGTRKLLLKK